MPHHITLDHISYAHPGEPPLFTDLSTVFSAPLTGLIGDNGTGKTTLFRLILGEIKPSHGTISAPPRIAYLPQDLGLSEHQHLADIFGITKILRALDALESGNYSPSLYDTIGDAWDIEERTLAILAEYGFSPALATDAADPHAIRDLLMRPLSTFSGGQTVTAALTALLLSNPEFILLDEPTNNLDSAAKNRLFAALETLTCPALIISHDRDLLAHMNAIAELHADREGQAHLRIYEGNYDTYRAARKAEESAAHRRVSEAKNEVRKAKKEWIRAHEIISRNTSHVWKDDQPDTIRALAKDASRQAANKLRGTRSSGLPKHSLSTKKPRRTCAYRNVSTWNLLRMHSRQGGRYWNYSGWGKTLARLYNRVPNLRMHTPKILFHIKSNLMKLIIRPTVKTFPRLLS